jgi:hypothetical protein
MALVLPLAFAYRLLTAFGGFPDNGPGVFGNHKIPIGAVNPIRFE